MDVNGTKYHLLLGRRDWHAVIAQTSIDPVHADWTSVPGAERAIAWDDDFGGIALLRQVPLMTGGAREIAPPTTQGVAADAFNNIFWIDAAGRDVNVQPAGLQTSGKFWSSADTDRPEAPTSPGLFGPVAAATPAAAPTLRGLAATTHHYLVAGTIAPAGLLIFDLDAGGAPCGWRWPIALNFQPWLLAPAGDGGVVILDFDAASKIARLWRLDRNFAPIDLGPLVSLAPARADDFSPVAGPPRTLPPRTFAGFAPIGAGTPVALAAPVGLAVLPDNSVLVLDANGAGLPARLIRIIDGHAAVTVTLDAALTSPQLGLDLADACSLAVTVDQTSRDEISGRFYVATTRFAQAFEYTFTARAASFVVTLDARALPLPNDARPTLVVAGADVMYAAGDRWFALAEQPRYRYLPSAVLCADQPRQRSAMVFDGKQPGCVWHRVMLDACMPQGCEVRIRSRAADEIERLDLMAWTEEPLPYRRSDGSELPFDRPFGNASSDHLGTFETLLFAAEGRYLQLEVTLVSDGRSSPRIRALRIYYPRFSYLQRYLPAIYREDREAADFLDRWLANPEGLLTAIEGRIANAQIVLDPVTAPAEYLAWLAGWVDAMLDPIWDDARRRLFLKFAWLLYRWRGSEIGLLAFLRLATDACPDESIFAPLANESASSLATFGGFSLRIVEDFARRQTSAVLLGDPTTAAPAIASASDTWQAADGGVRLHMLFKNWLLRRYGPVPQGSEEPDWATFLDRLNAAWAPAVSLTDADAIRFSAVPPSNAAERTDWEQFAASIFHGYSAVGAGDVGNWREFLARRYGTVEAFNQAYGFTGSTRAASFASLSLPAEHTFPADGPALDDWLQFALLALPIRRNAHRFTVLVPARVGEDPAVRAARLERIKVLVESEKPAHTSFDAKLFWALFQVGSARLGIDSVVGDGSRFLPIVLDAGYLREGYLAAGHPWSETDRRVIGRDRLERNVSCNSATSAPVQVR
jgi:phage tail-like protein